LAGRAIVAHARVDQRFDRIQREVLAELQRARMASHARIEAALARVEQRNAEGLA